jgi:phenylacetate-CoA ligase
MFYFKNLKKLLWHQKLAVQGSTMKHLRQLRHWQWLGRGEIDRLQNQRLSTLLCFSYEHVPYYREILQKHKVVDISGAVNLDNFIRLPLLGKNTLKTCLDILKSNDLSERNWFYNYSGGSTGEPVRFIQDKAYRDWGEANKLLNDEWTGYSFAKGQILLWGSEQDLFVGKETPKTHVRRWLRNEICLNAFRMTPDRMRAYVERINRVKPVRIFAYANSMVELARFVENGKHSVHTPQYIKTTASNLYQPMREIIERVFRAQVFDCYGSRELGDIASECDHHQGLHLLALTHHLEILRPDGSRCQPGEEGEIVITSLTNYAMPLIRYRIGDMGAWAEEKCTCGRGLPLLKNVAGRVTEVFVKRDGGVVLPEYLIHLVGVVLNSGWIFKYQVIQEDYDLIRVRIAPVQYTHRTEIYSNEMREISQKIKLVMGMDCRVDFDFVNDIESNPSGKYQYTISNVRN